MSMALVYASASPLSTPIRPSPKGQDWAFPPLKGRGFHRGARGLARVIMRLVEIAPSWGTACCAPTTEGRRTRRPVSDRRRFCTCVHTFAQSFRQNSIDCLKQNEYLARQIEPGSLRTLRVSFEGAAA